MIPHEQIAAHLASQPDITANRPFDDSVTAYWLQTDDQPALFAVLSDHPIPRLSLRCDPALTSTLRTRYETVSPARKLNRRLWNTIVLTGQLSWDEVVALIDHGYRLARASHPGGQIKRKTRPEDPGRAAD